MPRARVVGSVFLSVLATVWLAAEPAEARDPAACTYLAHQLVHYDTMRQQAAEAENELWVGRLKLQIARVEDQLDERCPEMAASNRASQQLAELLKLAARGALTFFTFGAY